VDDRSMLQNILNPEIFGHTELSSVKVYLKKIFNEYERQKMAKKKCKYNWHMAFRCGLGTAFYVLGIAAFIKYLFH